MITTVAGGGKTARDSSGEMSGKTIITVLSHNSGSTLNGYPSDSSA